MANINSTFNSTSNLTQSGFNGDLCATFACQAANDPVIEGLSAKQTIEARAALSGIAKSTAFGNSPGMAQAALSGIEISTVPPTSPSNTPAYKSNGLGNG